MDVRRWLEETKTPGPPASLGSPAGQHAREGAPRDAAKQSSPKRRKSKRPQKHTSSDSSLLRPDRPNGHLQPVTQKRGDGDGARAGQHVASDKVASCCSSELFGSADRSESELYARKPRRKTRPEIYEPKAGRKRRRWNGESRKDRHVPTREKDHRRTRARQSDMAHTFHAKNVAQDRLTLKPNESLGLFKKGRASSPVKGRGLPDLVFSEMRFLQKRSEPVDSRPAAEASRKGKRKGIISVGQEDEISTYFAAQPAALAEKDVDTPTLKPSEHLSGNEQRKPHDGISPSLEPTSSTEAPVDLPNKPYLGFGTRHGGSTNASNASFHIPWSDSGRRNSTAASQRSPRRSLPSQVRSEELNGIQDCSSNAAAKSNHDDEMHLDTSRLVPQEFALPRAAQPRTIVGSRHGVFPEEAQAHPSLQANKLQAESPMPPSSHKHRTEKHCQEITNVSPRQVVLQRKGHTTGTDVNEQRGRYPIRTQTGNRTRHAAPRGAGARDAQSTGNAVMAQDAIEVTSDATRSRALPRSSSPLGKLLRQCDDACYDSAVAYAVPVRRRSDDIDTRCVEGSVGFAHSPSQVKADWTAVPLRRAGGIAERIPMPCHMQAQDAAAASDDYDSGCVVFEDARMPEISADAMESEEYGYMDDAADFYLFRNRIAGGLDGGFCHDADGDYGGSVCDLGRSREQHTGQHGAEEEAGGALTGFWRPHKLY
ncbi:uncharacterized protein BKCO1_3500033 [Diplodia corticola]|uniref:Uncharacterized protein n=1 Tax=Diplodia corticola TaxID=236234 RepID=A0A1J9RX19_9PEZI|nr:uncharacterized protein BKCO1_3500033 [Diplodia corticola]OJD32887.1 hypothetical protein BKCO1_3500033 [Diplodia corticola]